MKIVFMGTPQAAVPSLKRCVSDGHEVIAVYSQPDRPSGRGNKVRFSPVKEFALAAGLEVCQPVTIKTDQAAAEFAAFEADIAVVVAYGRILPDAFLKAFRHGAVNVHFSLLPKFRGAAPVNWAIVEGESETGVTTMKMDAGLDTGDILLQGATPIGKSETAVELMERLSEMGAELLSQTLSGIDTIRPVAQDHAAASYAPMMNRQDGVIDWNREAGKINDRIRGFQPFPTAYSTFRGSRVSFWNAEAERLNHSSLEHGHIVSITGDSFEICCGNGTLLRVFELQPEGKRRMAARDFINGFRPAVDEEFV